MDDSAERDPNRFWELLGGLYFAGSYCIRYFYGTQHFDTKKVWKTKTIRFVPKSR